MRRAARVGLTIALVGAALVSRAPVPSGALGAAAASTTVVPATGAPTTMPPPTLPAAPAGFAKQVVTVYRSASTAAQALGQGAGLMPVSQYRQQVAAMSPDAIDALYAATRTQPEWAQIPALMEAVAADASASAGPARSAQAAGSVAPVNPASCSSGPPASAAFAAEIVVDVSAGVFNALVSLASAYEGDPFTELIAAGFAVAAGVAAVVAGVAQVVGDSLDYVAGAADDCAAANQDLYLANIESTTGQLYSFLDSNVSVAVAGLKTTLGSTQQSAQAIATTVDGLRSTLRQALTTGSDLESAIGGDTQAIATQLESDRAGISSSLADLDSLAAGYQRTAASRVATATSTVQAAIASSLQLSLEEIDSAAAALTDQISSTLARAVASANSTKAAIESEYEAGLRLRIEQALSATVPQVQFRLPASRGGLLDAAPVGVQSVVAADVADLERLGLPIAAGVRRQMKRAAADLAAQRYDAAFADLRQAYGGLADG